MSYELILTEKPAASLKVATALADTKPIKKLNKKVPYYELTHKKKKIVVACAVGHLYTVSEKEKSGWTYPVLEMEWKPTTEVNKNASYITDYLLTIKKLAKDANEFTVATDYDIEGEVIGLNVIRFICNQKDAKRMKFSTLTNEELNYSYEHASKHLDWPQAEAGETRHFLDWLWGINSSRALTNSIKAAGRGFKVLSTGRIQGPTLKIIVDRELEIKAFKPIPFWQIELQALANKDKVIAWHEKDKFWKKQEADKVMETTKGKKAFIKSIIKKQFSQPPPNPFDLTALQIEAYKCFKIAPKNTLELTQDLYIAGLISYPRTSSNQLPPSIDYKKVLSKLAEQKNYSSLAKELLKKPLKPNNGIKKDPAHPAVYPTGEIPKDLKGDHLKMYDLIVKRTLATFAEPATRENMTVKIDVNKENFVAVGIKTLKPGWHEFYKPYSKLKEEELPELKEGQELKVKKITLLEKETQPPKRFTQASIIKELERKNLGTKCLTADTTIKITNSPNKDIKISTIFKKSKKIGKIKGTHFAINNNQYNCSSIYNNSKVLSPFFLISKRKLKKDEGVYKIEFNDGTSIKLTEDHPILTYFDNKMYYKRVKNLTKHNKVVSSFSYRDKTGKIILTWENLINISDYKTCLYAISNELKKYRKKLKLSQYDLANKFNLKQPTISVYEKRKIIPFWVFRKIHLKEPEYILSQNKKFLIKDPFPIRMSSALSRTLAHLVGDGSIDRKKIERENCYDFRYYNTKSILIKQFIEDLNKIFNQDLNLKIKFVKKRKNQKQGYYITLPAVIGKILYIISKEIVNKNVSKSINSDFYQDFIGALFDDEGHIYKNEPKTYISNNNIKLLNSTKLMLKKLSINSIITKENPKNRKKEWKSSYKLYIRGRYNIQKFLEKIPFIDPKKKQRLINHLTNFYKFGRDKSSTLYENLILLELNKAKNKELTSTQLARKLNFNQVNVRAYLKHLTKNGYIKVHVVGISEYPRKKILYKLLKKLNETFYSLLGEKVINKDFITKTIKSIQKVGYVGYVYDITNHKDIPNFVLGNGVLVHNSTRATIVESLYQRNYVKEKAIEATVLGIKTVEILEKYCPEIVDEALTRHFEEEMESIRDKSKKGETILKEAKTVLTKIFKHFKKNEVNIGKGLADANRETQNELNMVGKCPNCKDGELRILYSRKTKSSFIACNKYPKCKTTFSLPQNALIKTTKETCKECNSPLVLVIRRGKRPWKYCIGKNCPAKQRWLEEQAKNNS